MWCMLMQESKMQHFIVILIVFAAAGWLAWKFTRKNKSSCGGCGSCEKDKDGSA